MVETPPAETDAAGQPSTPPLAIPDVHARVCEVESRLDLLRHQVDGWAAWPLLRIEVWRLLTGVPFASAQMPGRGGQMLRACRDLAKVPFLPRARHLVKTCDSGLLDRIEGRYVDIWFDDVIRAAGSTVKVESANTAGFEARRAAALIPRHLSTSALEIVSGLAARLRPVPDIDATSRILGRVIREDLGLASIGDDWVTYRLRRFSAARLAWRALARRVRPAFLLVADAGDHAAAAAVKEAGGTVLELQHGINDATHPGYSWTSYAVPYKASMPIPDRLLLYGEHWRRELEAGGFWGDGLRVVGSPRFDRHRSARPARGSAPRCTILFTSQGFHVARVAAFLATFLDRLERQVPVRLIIKLHPVYETGKGPYLEALGAFRDQAEVLTGTEGPSTFDWLREADLHVSIASAAHYEAVGLGVPTVILPLPGHETVLPLAREGHAFLAATPEDLASLVRRWRDLAVPPHVGDHYFVSGAADRVLRELQEPARAGARQDGNGMETA